MGKDFATIAEGISATVQWRYVVAMARGSEETRALDQDRNIPVTAGLDHTLSVKHDWCDRDNLCPGHNLGMS
jgi:hypothetical protein